MTLLHFWRTHAAEFATLFGQHVLLVGASTLVAICAGVPIGILAARRPRAGAPIVWLANVVQTIPSLAMFGFLLPLPFVGGLGARVAIFVLILYALLPIVRTTTAGLRSIDRVLIEAGTAMGMTPAQLMREVELPLALPSIVAGIRVAAVIGVGTATIAAAVGAGGLGEYIFRGLSMVDSTVILAGAVPSALLALTIDGTLTLVERALKTGRVARGGRRAVIVATALIAIAAGAAGMAYTRHGGDVIRIGSKNFTEQIVLGEIVAQTIEARTSVRVERRLNLGGTFICDRAVRSGDIDAYVEYSGTAQTAIFHQPVDTDRQRVFDGIRRRYAESGLTLLDAARSAGVREHVCHAHPRRRGGQAGTPDLVGRGRACPGLARRLWLRIPSACGRIPGPRAHVRAAVCRPADSHGSLADLSSARARAGRSGGGRRDQRSHRRVRPGHAPGRSPLFPTV
jgi:osmoprotectant transport system permease protein